MINDWERQAVTPSLWGLCILWDFSKNITCFLKQFQSCHNSLRVTICLDQIHNSDLLSSVMYKLFAVLKSNKESWLFPGSGQHSLYPSEQFSTETVLSDVLLVETKPALRLPGWTRHRSAPGSHCSTKACPVSFFPPTPSCPAIQPPQASRVSDWP